MKDLESPRVRERLEDLGLQVRDLIHDLTIDICARADECRSSARRGA
jgi:hypothetical protein